MVKTNWFYPLKNILTQLKPFGFNRANPVEKCTSLKLNFK